jgi:hypothetical protein
VKKGDICRHLDKRLALCRFTSKGAATSYDSLREFTPFSQMSDSPRPRGGERKRCGVVLLLEAIKRLDCRKKRYPRNAARDWNQSTETIQSPRDRHFAEHFYQPPTDQIDRAAIASFRDLGSLSRAEANLSKDQPQQVSSLGM